MFRSQIYRFLEKNIFRTQYETTLTGTLHCRSTSVAVPTPALLSNEAVPDKLYRKIEVEVRGNDKAVLQSYADFAVMAAGHLNIIVGRCMAPRKPLIERYTVLKSAHVHKKHRVQYEMRTYYHYLDFLRLTGSTADTFLEYIQRNLPEGVAMKVTKVELKELPESIKLSETWNVKS